MTEKVFDIAGYVFPIVSAIPSDSGLKIQNFIGSGFWINEKGHFLSCAHVLDLKEGEVPAIAQPFGENGDRYIPILETQSHPKYDIAWGRARISSPTNYLSMYTGTITPGLDVGAFGFTYWGKEGRSLQIDVRYLKGSITRTSPDSQGLPTAQIVETSFGSPSGFSGTPLIVDFKVAGMMYSNIESKLQSYSISETIEDGNEFRETAYRVYEYGLAHHRDDIVKFIKNCNVQSE